MSRSRKRTGPIAAKLGFKSQSDSQFMGRTLIKYWRQYYSRARFMKLEQNRLSAIAEGFLLSEGPQLWNGERVSAPIWPTSLREETEWMIYAKPLLVKFLEAQQGYQFEQMRKDMKETGGHGGRLCNDNAMDDDSSYKEQCSQTSEAPVESEDPPQFQQGLQESAPVCETTAQSQVTPWLHKICEESLETKPIRTNQTTLFYSVRGREYSLKKDSAADVLQSFADYLDNEYTTAKRNWRRIEHTSDKSAAEARLRILDDLSDEFVRIAGQFGAIQE